MLALIPKFDPQLDTALEQISCFFLYIGSSVEIF
jgi:hypothetical protein